MTKKELLKKIESQQHSIDTVWQEVEKLRELGATLLTRTTDINNLLDFNGKVLDDKNTLDRAVLIVYKLLNYFELQLSVDFEDDPSYPPVEQPKMKVWKIIKKPKFKK